MSAEMCVGSLMSGCSIDVTCFFQFTVNWGADVVKFGALDGSSSMLVGSNLARWGPASDAGGPGSTRKETLGFQAWISTDYGRISGRNLDVFGKLWHNNCVFWHACLHVTFFKDFGVRIWRFGAPESSILWGRYCKNQLFTYVGIMSILVSFLHGFRWLWDQF